MDRWITTRRTTQKIMKTILMEVSMRRRIWTYKTTRTKKERHRQRLTTFIETTQIRQAATNQGQKKIVQIKSTIKGAPLEREAISMMSLSQKTYSPSSNIATLSWCSSFNGEIKCSSSLWHSSSSLRHRVVVTSRHLICHQAIKITPWWLDRDPRFHKVLIWANPWTSPSWQMQTIWSMHSCSKRSSRTSP